MACEKPITNLTVLNKVNTKDKTERHYHSIIKANNVILQRRSAVAMDKQTVIQAEQFYQLLSRLMPDPIGAPFNSLKFS